MNLPLSWICNSAGKPPHTQILKSKFGLVWLASCSIEKNKFYSTVSEHMSPKNKLIIRGVDELSGQLLERKGFTKYQTGAEAVINLGDELKWKKSVCALVRRGRKKGSFEEILYSTENQMRLEEFRKIARHGKEPQLKFLFVDQFIPITRLLVIKNNSGQWLAALLISQNSANRYHAELLLKKKKTSTGIMEYLIVETCMLLQKEGCGEFSLGEVPFFSIDFSNRLLNLLVRIFKPIIKQAYNYDGLYYFKNKFRPQWRKVFLCIKPGISATALFFLTWHCNFIQLMIFKFFHRTN